MKTLDVQAQSLDVQAQSLDTAVGRFRSASTSTDPLARSRTLRDFWLTKLDHFNGDFDKAQMVKAFIVSGEYRQLFGP